jgi:hypothetical protein
MALEQTEHRFDRVGDVSRAVDTPVDEQTDFSLVLGGPLYQICRRTHLAGNSLQFLPRRIFVLTLVAWGPLLALSVAEGHAWAGSVLPFFYDVEMHVRLLLAMPLLVVAESIAHRRLRSLVQQFTERGLIPDSAKATFGAAIDSARRLRNSIWPEVALLAFVYLIGMGLLWRKHIALDVTSWHGALVDGIWQPTMAGWWLAWVSLPLFQFLLFRWYFRLFIWARFLWMVSRIKLQLMPTHPDRCGGLGFIASVRIAFVPLLLAQGVMMAGMIANRIFYAGAKLPEFKVELIALVAVMVFAVLGPLLVFCGQLEVAKRAGMREYGALAQRYVRDYDDKWLRGGAPPGERLLGTPDIQSLADLGHSYDVVKDMRWVPFNLPTVLHLSVTTLLPVLPLMLTMISMEELLERLIKLVF